MGIVNDFSQSPKVNSFGTLTGSASAASFPALPCLMVKFKADPANTPVVFLGVVGNANWPMSAGDDTGWVACNNLNDFAYRNSGTIHYWVQG
jgi:hypothetical protein